MPVVRRREDVVAGAGGEGARRRAKSEADGGVGDRRLPLGAAVVAARRRGVEAAVVAARRRGTDRRRAVGADGAV